MSDLGILKSYIICSTFVESAPYLQNLLVFGHQTKKSPPSFFSFYCQIIWITSPFINNRERELIPDMAINC